MAGLAFLQPWMLWGIAAISVPIAIHLIHKRRHRRLAFPAVEFILRSRKAVAKKFRLKQLLLLALRVALVGAVATAAARPLFPGRDAAIGPSGGPAAVAIAIDTSLSMRTKVGTGTAFDAAKAAAETLVKGLGPDVEATIVSFGADARAVPAVPTADKAALEAALADVKVGWSRTDIAHALDVAGGAIANSQKPRKLVYLFTDEAAPGWSEATPRDPQQKISWRVIDVTGGAQTNVALTGLDVHEDGGGATAKVDALSFSTKPIGGESVDLVTNDQPTGRNFVDLTPGGSASTRFSITSPPPGQNIAVARLPGDALAEDDVRWAVFRGRARVRTLLVDGDPKTTIRDAETFYLERALAPSREAAGSVAPEVVDAEGLARANLGSYDVVVLANVANVPPPLIASIRRWVENGGGLLFTAGDQLDPDAENAAWGDLLPMKLRGLRESAAEHNEGGATAGGRELGFGPLPGKHPVTQPLENEPDDLFSGVHFKKVELFEAGNGDAKSVLKFSDGSPALVEKSIGRGKVAFFASTIDRDWNDFPIATTFLPIVRREVRYLAGELGEGGTTDAIVGQPVKVEVGTEHPKVRVDGPEGFTPEVDAAVDGVLEVTPTLPGIYKLSREDGTPDERLAAHGFAANVDTAESDLRKVPPDELDRIFAGCDFATSGGDAGGGTAKATPDEPMWGLLLGAGLLAMVLESAVSTL